MRSFSDSLVREDQFEAKISSDYLGSSVMDIQNSRDDWRMNDDDDDDFNIGTNLDDDFDDDDDWEDDGVGDDDDDDDDGLY
jgi:hypothetical protein